MTGPNQTPGFHPSPEDIHSRIEGESYHHEQDGEILPSYTGVNAPRFAASETESADDSTYHGHVPAEFDLSEAQRIAFRMAEEAGANPRPKTDAEMTLEELRAKHLDSELPSDDARAPYRPIDPADLRRIADAYKSGSEEPTSEQKNANERAHTARARRQRWGK